MNFYDTKSFLKEHVPHVHTYYYCTHNMQTVRPIKYEWFANLWSKKVLEPGVFVQGIRHKVQMRPGLL